MKYIGKSLDGFSYAMKGLLDIYSICADQIPDPDCLSLRAFSFQMDGDVSLWFQTAFSWKRYMENLCCNLGLEKQLKVCEARQFFDKKMNYDDWFLMGEICGLEMIQTIRSSLYHATKSFYLCRTHGSQKVILCSPMGSPYKILDYKVLIEKAEASDGFVVWFKREDEFKIRIASPNSIAKQMFAWRQEHPELLIKYQLKNAEERYTGVGKEVYSMQYATMQFQIQFQKALEYFNQFGMIDESLYLELRDRLDYLPLIRKKGDLGCFEELEEKLWNGLEKTVIW